MLLPKRACSLREPGLILPSVTPVCDRICEVLSAVQLHCHAGVVTEEIHFQHMGKNMTRCPRKSVGPERITLLDRQMTTPPEVLFDRFFRNRKHLLDEGLLGKADLDQLTATTFPIALLFDIQAMMNNALLMENTKIPGHVDHDPFHFDYLNANEANAIAFRADGYSFIGIVSLSCAKRLSGVGARG